MKPSVWMSFAVLLSLVSPSRADTGAAATRPVAGDGKLRIVLVGDSTVTEKQGWGPGFAARLTDDVVCINKSLGGRSSKSYRDEGHWDEVLKLRPRPDYVLIQFGHNDQVGLHKGPERETEANTEFRSNLKRYVDEARAAGMKPVLITSLVRREFREDGKIHSSLVPYVEVTKEVAQEMKVPLIDLHARSQELCERLGKDKCDALSPKKPDGTFDTTHLNVEGAGVFGGMVADELARAVPELAPHVKAAASRTAESK
jgi:lysophospholipase L1-like esterase